MVNTILLRQRIEESGVKYGKLAKSINIDRKTLRNITDGKHTPSHHAIYGLSEGLKLSNEDIIKIFFPKLKGR